MSTAAAPMLDLKVQEYAKAWAASLAAAQEAIPGGTCDVLTQLSETAMPIEAHDLWIGVTSGEREGAVDLRISQKAALRLLQGSETEQLTDQNRASLLECFRRTAEGVRERVPQEDKSEFLVRFRGEGANPIKAVSFWLQLRGGASDPILIEVWFDQALVQRLQPRTEDTALPQPSAEDNTGPQIGMLMDVELAVTVRFGGRKMLLKDILDLCAGSVVELDQQIQEPVDLLLDGKLIARGDVVVVDGNYGLRVREIFSRAER